MTPLKLTVLDPCEEPKLVPVMVTEVPTTPEVGLRPVIVGVPSTVKDERRASHSAHRDDYVARRRASGTTAMIDVLLQLVIEVAVNPLKLTVLDPCEEPKLVPVMVTEEPTVPEVGLRPVIVGVPSTVKDGPALATPLTVTTTFPINAPDGTTAVIDVLLQLVIEVAVTPLKLTVLNLALIRSCFQ